MAGFSFISRPELKRLAAAGGLVLILGFAGQAAAQGAGVNPAEGMPDNGANAAAPATAGSDIGMDPNLNIDTTEALRRNL
jgi:hypothetical protein